MRRAARTDATAAALIRHAKQLGFSYLPINGAVDGFLYRRGVWHCVDWKSKGGTLTPAQAKLVAQGLPIRFISTVEQLEDLLT